MTTQTQTTNPIEDRLALIGMTCSIGLIVTSGLSLVAKIAIAVLG